MTMNRGTGRSPREVTIEPRGKPRSRARGALLAACLPLTLTLFLLVPGCGEDASTVEARLEPALELTIPPVGQSGETDAEGYREPTRSHEGHEGSLPRDTFVVTEAIDGDTLKVEPEIDVPGTLRDADTIELLGVDAPEKGTQPLGEEAVNFAGRALTNEKVTLRYGGEITDREGRVLVYVFYDGDGNPTNGDEMFNATLLWKGLAQVDVSPSGSIYADSFYGWQERAQVHEHGLWALSEDELCKLANQGNRIGKGTASCVG